MMWLKMLLVVLLVFFLIGRIKLGGMVEYSAQGVVCKARLGAIWLQLYPPKKREKKKEKPEKEKEKPIKEKKKKRPKEQAEELEHKAGGPLALVRQYLPLVGEAAGGMKRRITIDKIYLDFTAGGQDAAGTAMAFGYANMAIGMLWPVFEQNFVVKDHSFRTDVDFTAQSPTIYLNAVFSIRIGQLVSFAIRLLWRFVQLYRQGKKDQKQVR